MLTQRNATATRPAARYDKLVVTETADEVLLYDTEKHHIHHLNATTAAVWRLCDGKHTVVDLAREAGRELGAEMDEATVRLALTKLDDAGLLKESLVDELRMSRMSRRTFMQRAGVAGAIAVPAIVSTTSHAFAEWSQTTCGKPCAISEVDCVLPGGTGADCAVCLNETCQGAAAGCGAPCTFDGNCQGGGQGNICNRCVIVGEGGATFCGGNNFQCNSNGSNCGSDNDCVVNAGANNVNCTVCENGVCVEPSGFAARTTTLATLGVASASIGVNPSEGASADSIRIDVNGFEPGEQVTLTWGADGTGLGVIDTDDSGSGGTDTSVPFTVTAGENTIVATGLTSGITASAGFTVVDAKVEEPEVVLNPAMSVSPASGEAGTGATISASGFDPAESISISFAGNYLGDVANDSSTEFTVPGVDAGGYAFEASQATSGATASAGFEVLPPPFVPNPVVTVSANTANPGDVITAWVSGYHPDEVVSVTLDGGQVGTTGEGGAVDIQMSQPGTHEVGGYGVTTRAYNSVWVEVVTPAPQNQPELQQAPAAQQDQTLVGTQVPTQEATQIPTQEATQVPTQTSTEVPGTEVPGTEVPGTEEPDTSGT